MCATTPQSFCVGPVYPQEHMSDADCVDDRGESRTDYDTLFEILANQQRRILLHQIIEEEIAEVEALAEAVSEHVDEDPSQITTSLCHSHLPKLDGTGILDYDHRSEMVRYYGHPFLEEALDHTAAEDLSDR